MPPQEDSIDIVVNANAVHGETASNTRMNEEFELSSAPQPQLQHEFETIPKRSAVRLFAVLIAIYVSDFSQLENLST